MARWFYTPEEREALAVRDALNRVAREGGDVSDTISLGSCPTCGGLAQFVAPEHEGATGFVRAVSFPHLPDEPSEAAIRAKITAECLKPTTEEMLRAFRSLRAAYAAERAQEGR